MRLIYRTPEEASQLEASGRFRRVRELRGWRPGSEWRPSSSTYVYESIPDSAPADRQA